jgi:hypothetical protein
MLRYAAAILRDSHAADDVVSNVWLYLLARPAPYLIAIRALRLTFLTSLKWLRGQRRRPAEPLAFDVADLDAFESDDLAGTRDLLRYCWDRLEEPDRQLLVALSDGTLHVGPQDLELPEAAAKGVRVPGARMAAVAELFDTPPRTLQAARARILKEFHDCVMSGVCA